MPDSESRGALRILIIVNEFPPDVTAGTSLSTYNLAKYLVRRGHTVRVVVTNRIAAVPEQIFKGIELKRLTCSGPKGIRWLRRLYYIMQEARSFRPDVIQGQAVSCGLLGAITGRRLKVPSITFAQGQDVYQSKQWQRVTEIRWGCRWANVVLTVTVSLAEMLEKICGRSDICVLPHGIELTTDADFEKSIRHRKTYFQKGPIILNVGRLEYIKGQDVLLEAWPSVLKKFPRAKLWLVGEGSKREALKKQAGDLGIVESVCFWGYLEPEKARTLMSKSDLFVLPSRSEGFGIVTLEAMAQGLTVVASRVGGVPEVMPASGDYHLVPPENAFRLGDAINSRLQDSCQLSEKNRAWALRFVWTELVGDFEEVYYGAAS
jgi:glycosyltransferase involved in cell wall biosynthesis